MNVLSKGVIVKSAGYTPSSVPVNFTSLFLPRFTVTDTGFNFKSLIFLLTSERVAVFFIIRRLFPKKNNLYSDKKIIFRRLRRLLRLQTLLRRLLRQNPFRRQRAYPNRLLLLPTLNHLLRRHCQRIRRSLLQQA